MNTEKMPKLTLILAESEIERIPANIQHHPQIKSFTKGRNKPATDLLLDASYHHAAMKKLPESNRRGRPDIVHRCTLHALDSWINQRSLLQFFIHTRDDYVIWLNPKTRLPRQYHRFVGLMEQLFKKKKIETSEDILLTVEKKDLKTVLDDQIGEPFLLWEQGKKKSLFDVITSMKDDPLTIVIGGFPHGDFHQASQLIEHKFAVEQDSFTASYLLAKSICTFEFVNFNH